MSAQCPARNSRRTRLCYALLMLAALGFTSLWTGARPVSPNVIWQAITHFDPNNNEHLLIGYLRLPRTLLAIVVGAALGAAGVIMQTLTRNPLADPGLLGVNAGATLAIVLSIALFDITSVTSYMWSGIAGAGSMSFILFLIVGLKGDHPIRIVLAGAALTIVLLCLTQLVILNSDSEAFDRFRHWVTGSLQGRGFDVLMPVSILILFGLIMALAAGRMLDITALGMDAGRALGVNPHFLASFCALVMVILAGAATAAAGPVGFIGLTAPHFARAFVGSGHRLLLPWAMLLAAILVLTADILGRIVGNPGEIGVGIMTALTGGPCFVLLVKRWQGERI